MPGPMTDRTGGRKVRPFLICEAGMGRDRPPTIKCSTHGEAYQAFVCGHLVTGMQQRHRLVFCCFPDEGNPWPDAWCGDCQRLFEKNDGWTDETSAQAGVKLVCSSCYEAIRVFHQGGNPWN